MGSFPFIVAAAHCQFPGEGGGDWRAHTNDIILLVELLADVHDGQTLLVDEVGARDDEQRGELGLALFELLFDLCDVFLYIFVVLGL